MAVALVDVWHTKTGERTQLPEKSLKYWPDYTTTEPKSADKPAPVTGEKAS